MLLVEANEPPKGDDWLYEGKYDGFRCLLQWTDKEPILKSRNGNVLNHLFPEVIDYCRSLYNQIKEFLPLVFDGEIVYLINNYKSEFAVVQQRGRMQKKEVIAAHATSFPCHYIVFDLLSYQGESQMNRYLKTRKQQLNTLFTSLKLPTAIKYEENHRLQAIDVFEDSQTLWHFIKIYNGEGIIAKKKTSKWQEAVRSTHWLKIKNWKIVTVIVNKFDKGNGYFHGCVHRQGVLTEVVVFRHGMKKDELNTLITFFQANGQQNNETWQLEPSICIDIACIDFDGSKLREPRFHAFRLEMEHQYCNWQLMQRQLMPIPDSVPVTHPNKPVWPAIAITKEDYLYYLQLVSPFILPFLRNRPITLIRFPHGVPGESFYQKSSPEHLPAFVVTEKVSEHHSILCNNLETLLWLGNQLALEFHIPFQTIDTEKPTEIVFDLDPPSVDAFSLAVSGALHLKEIFDYFKLQSFVKTSGGKGLQVYIPLPHNTFSYEQVRLFTEFVCRFLCKQKPELYTIERLKKNRKDRLYLDYVQHAEGKTIISPFSTRGNEMGLVATPLHWNEVNDKLSPEQFTIPAVIERIKRVGNPLIHFQAIGEKQDFQAVLQHLNNQ